MATLKVKIQEDIILDNQDYSSKRVLEISGINEIYKRIITVPAGSDSTIALFRSTSGTTSGVESAALDIDDVKYIRVTNLDSSNSVNLSLQINTDEDNGDADDSATILLEAGKSFIMGTPHDGIAVNSAAASVVTSLVDLESILIDSSSNAVNIEVIIASA